MPVPQIPTRLLYPRKEAAYQLGISVRSLDYLIANKRLKFQKIGGRVLIHWKELQRFATSNHYEPVAPQHYQRMKVSGAANCEVGDLFKIGSD